MSETSMDDLPPLADKMRDAIMHAPAPDLLNLTRWIDSIAVECAKVAHAEVCREAARPVPRLPDPRVRL